jgi:hypothetical protein
MISWSVEEPTAPSQQSLLAWQARRLDRMAGFASFSGESTTSRDVGFLCLGVDGCCGVPPRPPHPQPYYQTPCGPPYTPDTTNCPYPY